MLIRDSLILIGVGGLFLVIGILMYTWGKREEDSYYGEIAKRPEIPANLWNTGRRASNPAP